MRTDAVMINLAEGDKMHKRMDRPNESIDSSSPGFAMHSSPEKRASFANIYSKVAQINHNAKQITDNTVPPFKESDGSAENQLLNTLVNDNGLPPVDTEETIITEMQQEKKDESDIRNLLQMTDAQGTAHAAEVIAGAVKKIAETLDLNINTGIDSLSLETVSQENIKQFAEIVSVLKSITEMLESNVRQGLPLDTGRVLLDVEGASQTASILRTELFKIELAINMLGIGEQVQSESARIMDMTMASGIPQARDPADLSMPLEQIKRIFGDLFEDCSYSKQSFNTPSIVKITSEPVKEVSIGSFDTMTYRTILKLEKKEMVVNENVQSAESLQDLKTPNGFDPAVAMNVSDLQSDVEGSLTALQAEGLNQKANQAFPMEASISTALQRTTEDNVMNQLTSKMQHLVRSGETEIRIQLKPESLGEVKLAIRMEGDIVTARIQVENQQVKQIVESNLQSLKNALSEQNLQAGSIEVNVGNGWGRQPDQPSEGLADRHLADDSDAFSNDSTEKNSVQKVKVGIETGHRYGNNSIEYYA
jgi:flagellar hook-length control protein FliK